VTGLTPKGAWMAAPPRRSPATTSPSPGLRPRDDGPGDPASRVISRCCHRSGEVGSRFADVLDGETATVPNARWRKVICDSLET